MVQITGFWKRFHKQNMGQTAIHVEIGREPDYGGNEVTLWTDLLALFFLVDEGASRYRVPPYNGGLFDSDAHPFLTEKALPDWFLARIIDQLGRAEDLSHRDTGLVRVDYGRFSDSTFGESL
jgi:hypothetical protein